ncbi:MAG: selenide, water dikinase SelD [Lysobacterales bacterium]
MKIRRHRLVALSWAMEKIRLTQYSHGAGCGCKIAPGVLENILRSELTLPTFANLVVGNDTRDDAAVYDLGDGTGMVSTTDFFMPIVDDPFDFGRIAATNAISDIYAMGGTPLMAIAILGWPVDKLDADVARQVVDGGRQTCADLGIALAGGHSIDSPEPIFGLAVSGRVNLEHLKRNSGASAGDRLYLTKPLGVGILTTAEKKGLLTSEHQHLARDVMCQSNVVGQYLAPLDGITAMTDVTGFGLGGHLLELCRGSGLRAEIALDQIPVLDGVPTYIKSGNLPGGSARNYASYGYDLGAMEPEIQALVCDPQTSGGLLLAVDAQAVDEVEAVLANQGCGIHPIGHLLPPAAGTVVQFQ